MNPFTSWLLAGAVISLIGIIGIARASKKKSKCTMPAQAVIVEVQKDTEEADDDHGKQKYSYTPVYEFTANGTVIRKSGGVYTHDKNKYHTGDTCKVMYNPDKPDEFLADGKNGSKAFGAALLLFGILIMAVAFTQR